MLLLKRGDYLPRERGNWDSKVVFADGKYVADETFYDIDDNTFHPELHYFVGGNSKVYGAALFRLAPHDFEDVRHPSGVAPAWPISYADLEPYYVKAEHLYCTGCTAATVRIRSPAPPARTTGIHPSRMPPVSHCIRCDRVDGFPCLLGTKADAEWAVVRPALAAHPNLTLMTSATVQQLLTDPSGRVVSGVVTTMADGSTNTFSADIVVLSAGSILSSVLLLKSANDTHPAGLGNSSDVVGRHYMRHNNLALMAFSKNPNPTVFQKTLSLNDLGAALLEGHGPGPGSALYVTRFGGSSRFLVRSAVRCL